MSKYVAWVCSYLLSSYHMCLALIRLTDGNTTADGYLEIFFQGEWYTMCIPFYSRNPDKYDRAVVCRELGYEGAATTNRRNRDQKHDHLLWNDLYCRGDENSVYNCDKCCTDQFYEYQTCLAIPEYACQSKPYIHNTLSSAIYVAIS